MHVLRRTRLLAITGRESDAGIVSIRPRPPNRPLRRWPALLALAVLVASPDVAAQSRASGPAASPYLPLDHWSYPVLDLWIARGDVTRLSPMTRPYRIGDVERALRAMDGRRLANTEAAIRSRLLRELGSPKPEMRRRHRDAPAHLTLGLEAGGRYVTQTHPDPLQPVLDGRFGEDRFLERAELSLRAASPFVVSGVRFRRDGIFRHDPRFPGGRVVPRREIPVVDEMSLRLAEAYVELQVPYLRLSFGRLDRNWGPAPVDGFLRSANPYSQDEIGYRFGTERFFLVGSISAPGDFLGDTVRHLSMHRLEFRASDRLALAVSEAVIHGGPEGRFRFSLANPVGIWQLAEDDGDVPHNKLGQLDAWWRPVDGVAVNGGLLADATNREGSCCQLGGTAGVELTRVAPGLRIGGQVTAIQSLAYRTERPWEEYSVDGVGLGWDKSDFVLFSLEADWFATPDLLVRPRLDVQRRGEGDFRQPRPPIADLPGQPRILSGVVETTLRPALGGRWASDGPSASGGRRWQVVAEWDLGVSVITDYDHVEGADRTELTGSLGLRLYTPRWAFRLP